MKNLNVGDLYLKEQKMINNFMQLIKNFNDFVKFNHTIFLFPFALSVMILADPRIQIITFWKCIWIVVALVSARNAAMIMNRILDVQYDFVNPRTNKRSLVTGQVSWKQAWLWLTINCILFILSSLALNTLCLILSPIALIWILTYSFSKRFTVFCHIWLGIATALAPLGTCIAITGRLHWGILVLSFSITCWVAGFDIIYACQDIDFDSEHKLKSFPAHFGKIHAIWISRVLHVVTLTGFFLLAVIYKLGLFYFIGIVIICVLLMLKQWVVHIKLVNLSKKLFIINSIVSITFLTFLVIDYFVPY